jgi:hypothetical protein
MKPILKQPNHHYMANAVEHLISSNSFQFRSVKALFVSPQGRYSVYRQLRLDCKIALISNNLGTQCLYFLLDLFLQIIF